MNFVRCSFLLGLVGLLTGCVTPAEMGYVLQPEPNYTTPVYTAPVYNTSPAYYATPVSGHSTMTVYDGYHPGYGGPRHLHHRPPPPPHGRFSGNNGGHGPHKRVPANQFQPPVRRQPTGKAPPGKGTFGKTAPSSRGAPGRMPPHGKGGGRKK